MELKFYSYSKSGDKIYYKSDLTIDDNVYSFKDNNDSKCKLIVEDASHVILQRFGEVKQELNFKLHESTRTHYKSSDLAFDLVVDTKEITINSSSIVIVYDLYYGDFLTDSFKIVFLIKNTNLLN